MGLKMEHATAIQTTEESCVAIHDIPISHIDRTNSFILSRIGCY